MKPGDMVGWKFRFQMDLHGDIGIIIERITQSHDPFRYWRVLFPNQGILRCREFDLQVVE
jgi:hypothetical protein